MSVYTPDAYVAALKREAFAIKKASGAVHCHVLEDLAKREGFNTWAALLAAHAPGKPVQLIANPLDKP